MRTPPYSPSLRQGAKLELRLFVFVLLVVIFEGALRKWVSPQFTNVCLLARDTAALILIAKAASTGKIFTLGVASGALVLWTIIVVVWAFVQLLINQTSYLIMLLGFRFWLLYLWFAVAAIATLDSHDLVFLLKLLWYSLAPMAVLAVIQHLSPPGNFINSQPNTEEQAIFRLSGDIVRTSGTFSFTAGYTAFLALVIPIAISPVLHRSWLLPRNRFALSSGLIAAIVGTIVSGSRGAIMFGAGMLVLSALFAIQGARMSVAGRMKVFMLVISVAALISSQFLLENAILATTDRFESASESEDLLSRVLAVIFGEPDARKMFTVLGQGIGAGSNAGTQLAGINDFGLGETEAARLYLEGGIVGVIWLLCKACLAFWGLWQGFRIKLETGEDLTMLYCCSAAIALLTWSASGQVTINAITYLLLAVSGLLIKGRGQHRYQLVDRHL